MRIAGEWVVLRERRMEDFEDHRRWRTPDAEWKRWDVPWQPVPELTDSDRLGWPLRLNAALGESPRTSLEVDTTLGEHVGMVSWSWAEGWADKGQDWASLGIAVFELGAWSRGLGTEAFALWTDYLFSSTNWHRLGFGTWSGNERMVRLGERLGFRREATFRAARLVDGERFDAVRYGLLREEWAASPWAGCSGAGYSETR